MMAIDSNNSGLFSLLGEELTKTTLRTNRVEPLTTWAVLLVVTLRLVVKCAHAHSNIMQFSIIAEGQNL